MVFLITPKQINNAYSKHTFLIEFSYWLCNQ